MRPKCSGAEEAVATSQELVMATVTPAFGSGPAQIHVGGFQKASVQSVGLLDCFCGLVRLFFFFFFSAKTHL